MILNKFSNKQIAKNFSEKELFSKSPDAPNTHFLDPRIVAVLQYIRTYLNTPIVVTSTYRTKKHNDSLGSSELSQHRRGKAIDFKVLDAQKEAELKNVFRDRKGELWDAIRQIGLNGVGIYNSFFHIDSRNEKGLQKDSIGNYAFWDVEKGDKKKGKFEDGNEKKPNILIIVVLMAIILILYKRQ